MAVWHIANPQKIEKSNPKILGTTTFHEITLWITFYGWVLKNALVFRRFISENIWWTAQSPPNKQSIQTYKAPCSKCVSFMYLSCFRHFEKVQSSHHPSDWYSDRRHRFIPWQIPYNPWFFGDTYTLYSYLYLYLYLYLYIYIYTRIQYNFYTTSYLESIILVRNIKPWECNAVLTISTQVCAGAACWSWALHLITSLEVWRMRPDTMAVNSCLDSEVSIDCSWDFIVI